jgi:hypothetical protein
MKFLVQLSLFDRPGNRVEDESVSGLPGLPRRRRNPGFQIVVKADGRRRGHRCISPPTALSHNRTTAPILG